MNICRMNAWILFFCVVPYGYRHRLYAVKHSCGFVNKILFFRPFIHQEPELLSSELLFNVTIFWHLFESSFFF